MIRRIEKEECEGALGCGFIPLEVEISFSKSQEHVTYTIEPKLKGSKFRDEMRQYYDERASEYDEVYSGNGPAFPSRDAYREDTKQIGGIAGRFGKGSLVDIACGTGFWFPYYSANCERITLLDQSKNMLACCRERVERTGLSEKCTFILDDFFEAELQGDSFDSAVVGFLLSHLNPDYELMLFQKLGRIMKADAELLLIDSAWSRQRSLHRKRTGMQKRVLNDGREFCIPKRYFSKEEIQELLKRNGFRISESFFGNAFLAVVAVR